MSFSKGNRFGESRGGTQRFSTYAEYIRQQFLISNNLSSRSGERLDGYGPASPLRRSGSEKKSKILAPSSPKSITDSPNSPPRVDLQRDVIVEGYREKYNNDSKNKPETDSPTTSPIKKKLARSWSGGRSRKVVPMGNDGNNPFGEKPPGPATYHQGNTLVKPSFNRLLNEPSMDTTGAQPRIRPISAGANTGKSQFRASDNRFSTTFGGKPKGSMFPQPKMNRCTSAPPGGRSPMLSSTGSRSKIAMPDWAVKTVSDGNPALKHPRYPPTSDKLMRRWSTVQQDSYVNYWPEKRVSKSAGRHRSSG